MQIEKGLSSYAINNMQIERIFQDDDMEIDMFAHDVLCVLQRIENEIDYRKFRYEDAVKLIIEYDAALDFSADVDLLASVTLQIVNAYKAFNTPDIVH